MTKEITVQGARAHNLKDVNVQIPKNKLVVMTGLSGSGKSSLAFDTIYAEGQRRYVESLSAYARQFLGQMDKPDVDAIEGLSPAISIDQKTTSRNPRSTVGTVTEIYDYLRLLYARVGKPICPRHGVEISAQSVEQMVNQVMELEERTKIQLLAPVISDRKGEHKKVLANLKKEGYIRLRVDGEMREISEEIELEKNKKHSIEVVIDRIVVKEGVESRLADSMETALKLGEGQVIVDLIDGDEMKFNENLACPICGFTVGKLEPRLFSFNSPFGACKTCDGLGSNLEVDLDLVVPDWDLSLQKGAIAAWQPVSSQYYPQLLKSVCKHFGIDMKKPVKDLPKEHMDIVLNGSGDEKIKFRYKNEQGQVRENQIFFEGVLNNISRRYHESISSFTRELMGKYMAEHTCPTCDGYRLSEEVLSVKINHKHSSEVTDFSVTDSLNGFVLDEPSIGLHQRDNDRLIETLKQMRNLDNTLIVVEHDEDTMLAADWLVDIGPGAGAQGGEIVASGPPKEVMEVEESLTGQYLSGKKFIHLPAERRKVNKNKMINIKGAHENNLKNIDVSIPLSVMNVVTGVSGSGKSTLINGVLQKALAQQLQRAKTKPGKHDKITGLKQLEKVVDIDQSPIGRTPRSNPATYTGVFDNIRDLFADTSEAKIRGYQKGRFSFNVKGGRCEACKGDGIIKIEMHFLPDVYVPCEVCHGTRYNRETLEVKYKGKNIAEVLDLRIEEALEFFENIPKIKRKLQTIYDVGLGYVRLGQSATTLSGGEAQRVKLASELHRRSNGKTFYILDEPTTGLHSEDIAKLLNVLQRLVDNGDTVLIIEHNLDVIKVADYLIDLGPEGGDGGGQIVATGTPEEVAEVEQSHTGQYLKPILERDRKRMKELLEPSN